MSFQPHRDVTKTAAALRVGQNARLALSSFLSSIARCSASQDSDVTPWRGRFRLLLTLGGPAWNLITREIAEHFEGHATWARQQLWGWPDRDHGWLARVVSRR